MPGNLQTTYDGDVVIFKVGTGLMSEGSTVQGAITQFLDMGYRMFVLDLKEISPLGMGDVRGIISATASIRAKSGEVVLVLSRNNSTALVQEMRLASILATYSTVEAAVKGFGPRSRSA